MTYSLNEIEALARRAARGAGMAWGLAEEAGMAVRWLCARKLPGLESLADLLTLNDGLSYEGLSPASITGQWRAPGGRLCPIIVGATLSDRGDLVEAGAPIEIGPVAAPLLLVPFAASAAAQVQSAIELSWQQVSLVCTAEAVSTSAGSGDLMIGSVEHILFRRAERSAPLGNANSARETTEASTWQRLMPFASRTLAPATEASRLEGAGAGLRDSD